MCCAVEASDLEIERLELGTPRWWWSAADLRAVHEKFYQYTLAAIENSSSLAIPSEVTPHSDNATLHKHRRFANIIYKSV